MRRLAVVDIGVESHQEPMVYMRADCEVCLAEGFTASTRDRVRVTHAPPVKSLGRVRTKIFGYKLDDQETNGIVEDIREHRYSNIEIPSFLSVCAGDRLDIDEITSLTRAMVTCGKHLNWPQHQQVFDKHCLGGLTGNRTTPLVVSISLTPNHELVKNSALALNPSKLN